MRSKFMRAAGGGGPIDPLFKNTVLLLHGDGTNGGQNNTFLDSSTNNFTVTRNGNATQGSFSPFTAPDGYWSVFSGSSNSRLSTTSTGILDVGTGDFTIEAWVYMINPASTQYINVFNYDFTGGAVYIRFGDSGLGSKLQVSVSGVAWSGVWSTDVTSQSVRGRWVHLALTRGSNVCRLFVDGVLKNIQSGINPSSYPFTSFTSNESIGNQTSCEFAGYSTGSYSFNGYVSNLRVVKSCLYTDTFTPSTTPLTVIDNTTLLTCQSNRFKDNSSVEKNITVSSPLVTALSPFASLKEYNTGVVGGSGLFDGSGDYLDLPSSSNYSITNSTTPFTFEAFIYPRASSLVIFTETYTGAGDNIPLAVTLSNGTTVESINGSALCFGWYNGTSWVTAAAANVNINLNAWSHIACVFTGSTSRIYINGVDVTKTSSPTPATSWGVTGDSGDVWRVGQRWDGSVPLGSFNGYISNLRFVRGTAVYTSGFTPPIAPLTPIDNTTLLLGFTNASIIDSTAKNVVETIGNAQVSTSVSKFGTGSMSFDGNGDILSVPAGPETLFGNNLFTIEFWVYANSLSAVNGLVCKGTSPASTNWQLTLQTDGKLRFNHNNLTTFDGSTILNINTWYHVAVVGNSTNIVIYLNGVQDGSVTYTYNYTDNSVLRVGVNRGTGNFLNGYIDDLRITNGIARYTANFTPPSGPFENR